MASTPPPKPARTLLDNQLSFKRYDTLSEICGKLIQWAGLVAIAYILLLCVRVSVGTSTSANILFNLMANVTVSKGIITLLIGSGWAYGLGQRSLRRKNIQRNVPAKNELEKLLDKNRTSSELTDKGTTPPRKKR